MEKIKLASVFELVSRIFLLLFCGVCLFVCDPLGVKTGAFISLIFMLSYLRLASVVILETEEVKSKLLGRVCYFLSSVADLASAATAVFLILGI